MVNCIVTMEDIAKEKLNSQVFNIIDENGDFSYVNLTYVIPNRYIYYVAQLLEFARTECDLITEAERDACFNNIVGAIITKTEYAKVVSNYLYLVTVWLNTKSNWEAFCEVRKCTSKENAEEFINSVDKWFKQWQGKMKSRLNKLKPVVLYFACDNITNGFNRFWDDLKTISRFGVDNQSIEFKSFHGVVVYNEYEFIRTSGMIGENYIATFERMVRDFEIELGILKKVGAKEFFAHKREELESLQKDMMVHKNETKASLEDQLKSLNDELNRQLELCSENARKFAKFLEEEEDRFAEMNPDMPMSEFDQAFEDYLETVDPGIEIMDEFSIRDEYSKKKQALIAQYDEAEDEEDYEMADFVSAVDYAMYGGLTLLDYAKEFAIFAAAKEGTLVYPRTFFERQTLLDDHITLEFAVEKLIEYQKDCLSKCEIQYLKKCSK